jgi:eukaryotic-like serine/threonine-protein kinase
VVQSKVSVVPPRLGKYRVIAKLGRGGMAKVYLAMSAGFGDFRKLVVIKSLREEHAQSREFVEMFLGEARLAARLSHPNVVDTYEVGVDDGHPFLVMEYLDGQPYHIVTHRLRETLPLQYHLKILVDVLSGLHYAHELTDFDGKRFSVVHRDVSPQNVFVSYTGQVKLLDFGVAKVSALNPETQAGVLKGKVAYLAPEQVRGIGVDRRADVFSAGVMLWEAIAGRRFASGKFDVAAIHDRVTGAEPRIQSVMPDTDPLLASICDRALELDAERRFQTAEDMRLALEGYLAVRNVQCKSESLGQMLARAFNDDRVAMRASIEEQMRLVESSTLLTLPNLAVTVSTSESKPSAQFSAPVGGVSRASQAAPPDVHLDRPRGRLLPVLLGAVALVVAGLALVLLLRRGASGGAQAPSDSAVTAHVSEAASSNAPDKPQAEIVVLASPPDAKIFIDGVRASTNPFRASYPRDPVPHKVRVEAPGYDAQEQLATLGEGDVTVRVTLSARARPGPVYVPPRATPRAPSAAVSPPGPAPAPPPAAAVTEGQDLRRLAPPPVPTIDNKDPYAQ